VPNDYITAWHNTPSKRRPADVTVAPLLPLIGRPVFLPAQSGKGLDIHQAAEK
jgi:hypothetical protein